MIDLNRPTPAERLTIAMATDDHASAVFQLATSLGDEGLSQVDLYQLYSAALTMTDGDDPRYDSLADTLDLIWGGGWAKGRDLYPEEVTDAHLH